MSTIMWGLCCLLGVQKPIMQGGMAWVADASLAAAVSNAGGMGLIAAGSAPPSIVQEQIQKAKQLTQKPFGVNVMLMNPEAEAIMNMIAQEGVSVVTTGAGNPSKYIPMLKEKGIKVIPVIPSAALAVRMERAGADAVVAEGCEAGGHIGELTTMALVPQVVDAVKIPVIAAGGIADGRGLAAARMLGACGAQIGTRFMVANECTAHDDFKQKIIDARDSDSTVTGRSTGHPVRVIKNRLSRMLLQAEKDGMPIEEIEALAVGGLRLAVREGDMDQGSLMAGQIAGLVKKRQSALEIIDEIVSQANTLLEG